MHCYLFILFSYIYMGRWQNIIQVYILAFLIFAIFYFLVSGSCAIETDTFLSAIYFSVETMVTIGYTTADPFFNQCGIAAFLIVVQVNLGLLICNQFMFFFLTPLHIN